MLLLTAQSEEVSEEMKEATAFTETQPILEGGKQWSILVDASELEPHFVASQFVSDSSNKRVVFNLKVTQELGIEEARQITGVWLKLYDQKENLIGAVDHTSSSLEKCAKLFSIPENLKKGAVFRVEVKCPYEFTSSSHLHLVKIVLSKINK